MFRRTVFWVGLLTLAVLSAPLLAQQTAPSKIRILLTTGGHKFEEGPFYAMFDAMPGIEYTKAQMPEALGQLKPGLEKQYDALVMYDLNRKMPDAEQQKAILALLDKGIGVVSMHHNLGANFDWPAWRSIIGGQYVMKPVEIDGHAWPKSTFSHGEEMKITIADPQHPITKGLSDFVIHDEAYGGLYVAPGVHLLLTTDHPKNSRQICWTTRYGHSPVVCLMLGHDSQAYENPDYRKVLERSIRWVVAEPK